MPEGPSLVILKEETARFVGQEIVHADGNTWAIDTIRLIGQPVVSLPTWGLLRALSEALRLRL